MKCLSRHSADIAEDHRWHWTYLCRKTNTGQKSLTFLSLKIWSKKDPSIKNVRASHLLSCMLLRKIFYFICKANSNYYHILMIDIII